MAYQEVHCVRIVFPDSIYNVYHISKVHSAMTSIQKQHDISHGLYNTYRENMIDFITLQIFNQSILVLQF